MNKVAPIVLILLLALAGMQIWSSRGSGVQAGEGSVSDADLVEETTTITTERTFVTLAPLPENQVATTSRPRAAAPTAAQPTSDDPAPAPAPTPAPVPPPDPTTPDPTVAPPVTEPPAPDPTSDPEPTVAPPTTPEDTVAPPPEPPPDPDGAPDLGAEEALAGSPPPR